jgi:hypothetical protein
MKSDRYEAMTAAREIASQSSLNIDWLDCYIEQLEIARRALEGR